jgi:transcriptional regulator with XRE-family HTH domain
MALRNFGIWVRETRIAKGLSAKECAARIGVSTKFWERIEEEGRNQGDGSVSHLHRSTVDRFALGLDVPSTEAYAAAGFPTRSLPVQKRQRNRK